MGTQIPACNKPRRTKTKMNKTFILILVLALITAEAAPRRRYYGSNYRSSGYRSYGNGPNQGLKALGRNKFVAGAGLAVAGTLLGNQDIANLGVGVAALGLGTKGLAHFFGKKK